MHFDWTTLALQTINLLVLVWLLRRFLFQPVLGIVAQRRASAEKLLTDAAAQRDAAQVEAEKLADQQRMIADETDRILAEARVAANAEKQDILLQAHDEAAKTQGELQTKLSQERAQSRRELEAEAYQLAVTIAARLLSRIPANPANAALLESLDSWLAGVPNTDLRNLASPGDVLEVVTAVTLNDAERTSCSASLRQRLGDGVSFRFAVDPSLIAGIELRGPHARIHNNWRTDLDRIAGELCHDDKHLAVA